MKKRLIAVLAIGMLAGIFSLGAPTGPAAAGAGTAMTASTPTAAPKCPTNTAEMQSILGGEESKWAFLPGTRNEGMKYTDGYAVFTHPGRGRFEFDKGMISSGKFATQTAVYFCYATGGQPADQIVVGTTTSPTGGQWRFTYGGGVTAESGAKPLGSLAGNPLNQPVVNLASTSTGNGYWMVATDGGIFAYGDAPFYGSTGGFRLNRPIVRMAATHTGRGYWLVASDGGIFSYGDARFFGSTGAFVLTQPIVSMAQTLTGNGYWLVASDGGIFAFGDAPFYGSYPGVPGRDVNKRFWHIVARPNGGYDLYDTSGGVTPFVP